MRGTVRSKLKRMLEATVKTKYINMTIFYSRQPYCVNRFVQCNLLIISNIEETTAHCFGNFHFQYEEWCSIILHFALANPQTICLWIAPQNEISANRSVAISDLLRGANWKNDSLRRNTGINGSSFITSLKPSSYLAALLSVYVVRTLVKISTVIPTNSFGR